MTNAAFIPLRRLAGRAKRALTSPPPGAHYYCAALNGESNYNISINADMTVSCSCQDVDGSGRIGDLTRHSLSEILHGPGARSFRERLADGILPTPFCAGCQDLRRVSEDEAQRRVTDYALPRAGIMLENTSACNYACTCCNRSAIAQTWTKRSMNLADMERAAAEIGALGVESIFFFKLGEPFLSSRVKEEMTIVRRYNPTAWVVCSTNGSLLDSDSKRDAALMMDHVIFSIDGPDQDTMVRHQAGGDFAAAVANLRALVGYRNGLGRTTPMIEWKCLVFNWNDRRHQVNATIAQARAAGVDVVSFIPTQYPVFGRSLRYRWGYVGRVGDENWERCYPGSARVLDLRPAGTGRSQMPSATSHA
ncbi:MAG: radical SAM protein [Acidimicrobiia bacterium]|nr:radical SAM protein [Acidimicrobiia bacterium]